MRYLTLVLLLFCLSCGKNSKKVKTDQIDTSINKVQKTDTIAIEEKQPPTVNTPEEEAVNLTLQSRYGEKWKVLNDRSAKWMKDAYDYFIVPRRKNEPNYPYITIGDFNGDGKSDTAALVSDSLKRNYQIAILMNNEIKLWEEDIADGAALSTVPKGEWKGMSGEDLEPKTVRSKNDGIEVTYFESASFIVYYDKKVFKRLQTSD